MSKSLGIFCILLLVSINGSSLRNVMTANEAITNAVGLLVEPGNGQAVKSLKSQTDPKHFHETEQSGDMDDDNETDVNDLFEATMPDKEHTYKDISDYDELELSKAEADSDNPVAAYSFKPKGNYPKAFNMEGMESLQHALERDDDEIPDDADDSGDDNNDGDTLWVLISSFQKGQGSTGKIHAIPKENDEAGFTLISGLERPVGMCFDVNHEFLYICDMESEKKGFIYQYEIDWDSDDTFELRKQTYAVVYKGAPAYDCSVDEYGNLFFSTADNKINIASYLDLWSGFKNQHTTIYDETSGKVNGVMGLDVINSENIWFTNLETPESAGVLNKAKAQTSYLNSAEITIEVSARAGAYGVGVSDDYAFFTTNNQVFAYDYDEDEMYLKSIGFEEARGISYGDEDVFVADHGTGHVYRIDANDGDQEFSHPWVHIQGAYAVHCINLAAQLIAAALFLLY